MKEQEAWLRKIGSCVILVVLVSLIAFGVYYVWEFLSVRNANAKDRWELGLPDGLECVYHKQTGSFRGDGWHYDVYSMLPGHVWLEELYVQTDTEVEAFYSSAVEELHVESAYCNDLRGTKYLWKQHESEDGLTRAVAIYDIQRGYLYVAAYSI